MKEGDEFQSPGNTTLTHEIESNERRIRWIRCLLL